MNKQRPVNLDLSTISLPITAYTSILHRVSGVFLMAAVAVLLYLLDLSLGSAEGFARAKALLENEWIRLLLWVVLAGFAYHTVAGVRHLIMDMGVGETLEGGKLGAKLVFVIAGLLIVLAGVWVW